MDDGQQYVSGSEDEDEITLLDVLHAKTSSFDQFTDLQYLAHPIYHQRIRHLMRLSAEHSLSTENAVKSLIQVIQGLSRRVDRLENVLMDSLHLENLHGVFFILL
jgi:hypothetical protein